MRRRTDSSSGSPGQIGLQGFGGEALVGGQDQSGAVGHDPGVVLEHRGQDGLLAALGPGAAGAHRTGSPAGVHTRYRRSPRKNRAREAQ